MIIRSRDLPQADRIDSVVAATMAVATGARTDMEIANRVPGIEGDARQGRYYRRAAQDLGFITNTGNSASPTELGLSIAENPDLSNPSLVSAVVGLKVYQSLVPFIQLNPQGLTRAQIQEYLFSIADPSMGQTMIPRRISTALGWLKALGILVQDGPQIKISNESLKSYPVMQLRDIAQPVLPKTGELVEYQEINTRLKNAGEQIVYYVDQAKRERANASHQRLVHMVAQRINSHGARPTTNAIIDLAAEIDDSGFIFEMKSTTDKNVKTQVRKGISQLYEYRYLQRATNAQLVLVIERPLDKSNRWMGDYIENDRGILMIWDGDDQLYGSDEAKRRLEFLNLI